jgi:NAD(P)H-dependent FMN reductase
MAAMQILIFAGSTRQQSHNRRLAAAAAGMARELGAQPTLLELSDFDIPMYNADLEARGTPPDVLRLKAALHSHPAWLICSPEQNRHGITGRKITGGLLWSLWRWPGG